jgi:hypothetical protein
MLYTPNTLIADMHHSDAVDLIESLGPRCSGEPR